MWNARGDGATRQVASRDWPVMSCPRPVCVRDNTAEYGDMTRGKRVVGPETRAAMKKILADIQSGAFADEWITEYKCGTPHFRELRKEAEHHPIEEVGAKLRGLMPWLGSNRLVDRAKN